MGNKVPHKIIKHIINKIRLLYKNPPSLDVKDSILSLDCNKRYRLKNQKPVNNISSNRKVKNKGPNDSAVKEWTDEIIPLLVMNVPRITNKYVEDAKRTFHVFNMPLFSCIIDE